MPLNTPPKSIAFRLKTLSAAIVSAMLFSNADAAGLGKLTVLSSLGQPLRAEIELISSSKDESGPMTVKLASTEAFRQANIEFNSALLSMRFTVETRGDMRFVRVTSTQPMNEPFIDMVLELNSSTGRVMREYVFLLDPVSMEPAAAATAHGSNATPKADPGQAPGSSSPAEKAFVESKPAPQAARPSAKGAPIALAAPAKTDIHPESPTRKPAAPAPAGGKPKLTVTGVSPASVPNTGKDDSAAVESYTAMEREIAEANARVKALEQKVSDLQKLLELTNSLLAEMQKQRDLLKGDVKAAAPVAETTAASPAAGTDIQPAEVKSDAPAATAAASAPAPVSPAQPQPAVPKPAAAPPEADLTGDLLLPGAGLLLAALGAFGIYASRRKKKAQTPFDATMFADSSQETHTALDSTGGPDIDPGTTVFHSSYSSPAGQSNGSEVDVLSEADVYIAYGRDVQAENILKEALRDQPERHAICVKLLSIYAARKDPRSFEPLARELYGKTNGEGEEWAQAAAMGAGIDPDNPLYTGGNPPAAADADALTASFELPEEHKPESSSATLPQDPMPEDVGMLASASSDIGHPSLAAAVAEPVSNNLDFDLEGMRPDEAAVPTIPSVAPDEPKAEVGPIDFDFVLPGIPATAKPETTPEIPAAPLGEPQAEIGPIDFDFLIPETLAAGKPEASESEAGPVREADASRQTSR